MQPHLILGTVKNANKNKIKIPSGDTKQPHHILLLVTWPHAVCQGHSHPKLSAPLRGSNHPLLASTELAW